MQFLLAARLSTLICTHFGFRGGAPARPDGKLALVALHVLRDAHVARHQLHLVLVLGFPVRVLHFLGEDEVELKEEHSPLSALSDQFLGIPDVESVLEDDVAQLINTYITAIEQGQVECVIGLEIYNVTKSPTFCFLLRAFSEGLNE